MMSTIIFDGEVESSGHTIEVTIERASDGTFRATVDGQPVDIRKSEFQKELEVIAATADPETREELSKKFAEKSIIKKIIE
jgi:hypothetical protein